MPFGKPGTTVPCGRSRRNRRGTARFRHGISGSLPRGAKTRSRVLMRGGAPDSSPRPGMTPASFPSVCELPTMPPAPTGRPSAASASLSSTSRCCCPFSSFSPVDSSNSAGPLPSNRQCQDAVDGTSGADVAVAGDSELEGAIRATVAESAGADADQVDVTSDGPVVTVALPDETLGAGPVRFLDGTTLSARASAGK